MILLCATVFATACDSSEEGNARIEVWLTDAPGDFDEVNVEVVGVEINSGEDEQNGWRSVETKAGVYNLLELTNGLDTLLGAVEIPAGRIAQIRLKLGSKNTLKIDDETYPLTTPSAQQSGLKLRLNETFTAGVTYKILLDFDVARSIVSRGNGGYSLKPVIRSIAEATSGAIKGSVEPKEAHPAIYAIANQDTVGTTFTDSTGQFLLRGIPAGSYRVVFAPAEGYQKKETSDVAVSTGAVTDLGEVVIEKQ